MTLVQEFQIKLLDGLRTLSNPEEFQILFYNLLIEQGPVSLFLILENPESRNFELLDLQTADESIRRSFSEKVWSVEQIERDDFVSEDIDGGIAESHLLKYVFPNPKISEQEVYYAYWKISDEKRLWIICDFHGENSRPARLAAPAGNHQSQMFLALPNFCCRYFRQVIFCTG